MGLDNLENQLKELGYDTWRPQKDFVAFKFKVPHGRFKDKEITIALQAPQFPTIPPSGPHINPHLLPCSGGGGQHPLGGIHRRNVPTADYQYWSRPFHNWNASKKNAAEYLGFIRTLFDFV